MSLLTIFSILLDHGSNVRKPIGKSLFDNEETFFKPTTQLLGKKDTTSNGKCDAGKDEKLDLDEYVYRKNIVAAIDPTYQSKASYNIDVEKDKLNRVRGKVR